MSISSACLKIIDNHLRCCWSPGLEPLSYNIYFENYYFLLFFIKMSSLNQRGTLQDSKLFTSTDEACARAHLLDLRTRVLGEQLFEIWLQGPILKCVHWVLV